MNDCMELLLKSPVYVGTSRGGRLRSYRISLNFLRNIIIIVVISIIMCVLVYWIHTGPQYTHQQRSGLYFKSDKRNHTATLIFLHGLGGNGKYMCSLLVKMNLPRHIRHVCPTADIVNVTFRNRNLRSWFNIFKLNEDSKEDNRGINIAAKRIESLIVQEIKLGVPRNRIILGGHSQGGATSLYTALTSTADSFAGVFGTSTWLPLLKTFPKAFKGNQHTPLLQIHGDVDKLVAFSFGKKSSDMIKSYNHNAQFKVMKGLGHVFTIEVEESVKAFVIKHLPLI